MLSQALMELEVEEHVGAGRHERLVGRTGHRDGYPERSRDTRAGSVELKVPRVRDSRATSLRFWSRAGAPRGRFQRWFRRRRTSTASPRPRWTIWSRPSG